MRLFVFFLFALSPACNLPRPADIPPFDATNDATEGFDGTPDTAIRGTVYATAIDPSGLVPTVGTPIVFMDPDGAVVAEVPTDLNGSAHADILPGGIVTAVYTVSSTDHRAYAILGAKPGDHLVIAPQVDGTDAGTFTVNFPSYSGATSYNVYGPCGKGTPKGSTSATLVIYGYCKEDPMTVSVEAVTSNGFEAYLEKGGVPFTDGGTTTIGGSWSGLFTFNATLSDVPGGLSNVTGDRYAPDRYGHGIAIGSGPPTGSTFAFTGSVPTTVHAIVRTELEQDAQTRQVISQQVSGLASTYGLDVAANLLPWLGPPTVDVATGNIATPAAGSGTADFYQVNFALHRFSDGSSIVWWINKAGPGDFTLPTMPTDVAVVNPQPGDQIAYRVASIFDYDNLTGYDDARNDAFDTALLLWPPGATSVRYSTASK